MPLIFNISRSFSAARLSVYTRTDSLLSLRQRRYCRRYILHPSFYICLARFRLLGLVNQQFSQPHDSQLPAVTSRCAFGVSKASGSTGVTGAGVTGAGVTGAAAGAAAAALVLVLQMIDLTQDYSAQRAATSVGYSTVS